MAPAVDVDGLSRDEPTLDEQAHGRGHILGRADGLERVGRGETLEVVGILAGRRPDMFFGSREGAIEAAFHGISPVVVIVDWEFTDFLKRLEEARLTYQIHDLISS